MISYKHYSGDPNRRAPRLLIFGKCSHPPEAYSHPPSIKMYTFGYEIILHVCFFYVFL